MSKDYSQEDAIFQAKLSILEAQRVARHTQDWVIITDRWLSLARFIGDSEADFVSLGIDQVRNEIATVDEIRARFNLPPKED